MTKASSHNGYLDFLKFVFALGVMGVHTELAGFGFTMLRGGYLGVDFFFLVSGYFTTRLALEMRRRKDVDHQDAIVRYFIKQIKRLYPFYFVSCLYGFLVRSVINSLAATPIEDLSMSFGWAIFDLIPVQIQGICGFNPTQVQWYVGAFFVVSPLLFALVLRYGESFSLTFAPIISTFLIGLLQMKCGGIRSNGVFVDGIVFDGVLRAVGDMFLASTLYSISARFSCTQLKKAGTVVVRLVMLGLGMGMIWMCFVPSSAGYSDAIFIPVIFLYLLLLFSWRKYSAIFDTALVQELQKISVVLFMIHIKTGQCINAFWYEGPLPMKLFLYYACSILIAWGLYYLTSFATVQLRKGMQLLVK